MTAVEIPYLHVGGQARLQAGTYTVEWQSCACVADLPCGWCLQLYWAIRVEKDSSLDDLVSSAHSCLCVINWCCDGQTFEIYVPSNETEEMGDNTRIYKISPVLELSRSRGKVSLVCYR